MMSEGTGYIRCFTDGSYLSFLRRASGRMPPMSDIGINNIITAGPSRYFVQLHYRPVALSSGPSRLFGILSEAATLA